MSRSWTWRHAFTDGEVNLPPLTRLVLHTIGMFMNDLGQNAYPTIEQLADKSGLSASSVKKHMKVAIDLGYLKRSKHGFAGKKWANNQYFPLFPKDLKGEPCDDPLNDEGRPCDGSPRGEGRPCDGSKVGRETATNVPYLSNKLKIKDLSFEVNRTTYFGKRKIQFHQVFDEAEYSKINSDSRHAAEMRSSRDRAPQPNHWPEVDKYIGMSGIRERAERLGLINWFTSLADYAIGNMRRADVGYSQADVDEVICKSGFAQLMTAFEAEQAEDAA